MNYNFNPESELWSRSRCLKRTTDVNTRPHFAMMLLSVGLNKTQKAHLRRDFRIKAHWQTLLASTRQNINTWRCCQRPGWRRLEEPAAAERLRAGRRETSAVAGTAVAPCVFHPFTDTFNLSFPPYFSQPSLCPPLPLWLPLLLSWTPSHAFSSSLLIYINAMHQSLQVNLCVT